MEYSVTKVYNRLDNCGQLREKRVYNNSTFFLADNVIETYLHHALEKQLSAKKEAIRMYPKLLES